MLGKVLLVGLLAHGGDNAMNTFNQDYQILTVFSSATNLNSEKIVSREKKLISHSLFRPFPKNAFTEGNYHVSGMSSIRNNPEQRIFVNTIRKELEKMLSINLFISSYLDLAFFPETFLHTVVGIPANEYSLIVNLGQNHTLDWPITLVKQLTTYQITINVGEALLFNGIELLAKTEKLGSKYDIEGTSGLYDDDTCTNLLLCNFVNADGNFVEYAFTG